MQTVLYLMKSLVKHANYRFYQAADSYSLYYILLPFFPTKPFIYDLNYKIITLFNLRYP